MANKIIQNKVKEVLEYQGRTTKWLIQELYNNKLPMKGYILRHILNNINRSIKLHELIVIARILNIHDCRDLLVWEGQNKVMYVDEKLKGIKHVKRNIKG